MKYLDDYRRTNLLQNLAQRITQLSPPPCVLMEVCGTHTTAIARYGLRQLLPSGVRLISGPGCPVCVTPESVIDHFLELGKVPHVTLTCFGDMMRVPGSYSSLERERAAGVEVRIVYSPMEALSLAADEPEREVTFFGVGFETTAPAVALAIEEAQRRSVTNFSLLCAHKLIPPALRLLVNSREVTISGFICPGHVSTVIGTDPYRFLSEEYGVPCVIAGFEPSDVLQSVEMLLLQLMEGRPQVQIQYARAVKPEGNPKARALMERVFTITSSEWRGFGEIPQSGLSLREEYAQFDAGRRFAVSVPQTRLAPGCACGAVLRGAIEPIQCPLFGKACIPDHPVGACMVSSEGACAAHYRYRSGEEVSV